MPGKRSALTTAITVLSLTAAMLLIAPGPTSARVATPQTAHAAKQAKDPRLTRRPWADPGSQAAYAAKGDKRFQVLARTPQAVWLNEQTAPVGDATRYVRQIVSAATRAKRTPVFVVYAIPGRDCSLHSAGGYRARTYKAWITKVAAGLKRGKAMVMLEPDAVASLGDCAGQGDRAGLLRFAVKRLTRAGAWVYLDAGHSNWQSAPVIAKRLKRSGVAGARGFVTNVSNFRTTASEKRFGRAVRTRLAALGIRHKRQVIDISRNGAGPAKDAAWCNPPHARIGAKPRVVDRGGVDALLWIKRPGESDGPCHGGPNAGAWWPQGALRLLR
ncbi:glycoside hydrolase family 6 protein [Nocardioides dubius]|uniref:Glucanase n=1 Tax=Nocardioides dubius TaxID=317019 RepID=A0ABP4ED18_9ACTN